MKTRALRNASITLLGLGLGCIDVGSIPPPEVSQGDAGTDAKGGAGPAGQRPSGWPAGGVATRGSADWATGSTSWTGYVENYLFASGSDALALMFASDAAGVVHGTLVFGKGTPPPPATDPNVGYPPNFLTVAQGNSGIGAYQMYVAEGYYYELDGTLANSRLRLTVALQQLWADWCLLQTSSDGPSFCGPNVGGVQDVSESACLLVDATTKKSVPIDCSKVFLCMFGPCDCNGNGPCSLSQSGAAVTFDISLNGSNVIGSIAGALGDHNVVFTKN
jgi:hypothetical protein